jgi:CheY-like chemotaxis protein
MDGFATTALIRARDEPGRRVPIVALTAHDAVSYREMCSQAGMDDLLTKPYTLEECTQTLRKWLPPKPARPVIEQAVAAGPANDDSAEQPVAQAAHGTITSIDAAAVARLQALRSGLYPKLVDLFQASSSQSLTELRIALETPDLRAGAAIAHKLASAAANVGALCYAREVRELERLCEAGEGVRARHLQEILQQAHRALLEELMCIRLRATA